MFSWSGFIFPKEYHIPLFSWLLTIFLRLIMENYVNFNEWLVSKVMWSVTRQNKQLSKIFMRLDSLENKMTLSTRKLSLTYV